jgi:ubiquinone/menaquinone biosynthesis C-methylase UbiE
MTVDLIDDWCAGIPGLSQTAPGMWSLDGRHVVSFPDGAHTDLAAIEDASYWFAHRNSVITSVIKRYTRSGPFLDIGGGNGFVSVALRAAGLESIVVEPGEAGAAIAHKRGNAVIQAPFQTLPLADGTIPAAGMFDVLEHIEDAKGALARLHRVMRKDGMLYIAVPAYNWLWSAQDTYGGHYRRYTVGGLKVDLEEAGFQPLYGTYFFAALVPAVLAFRTIPSLLKIRRGDDSARSSDEHRLPDTPLGRMLARSLARERASIDRGGVVRTGTSCLVAARKI